MRKIFGWALLHAALFGFTGTSYGDYFDNNPSCAEAVGACDNGLCNECQDSCGCECLGNWFDNTVVFAGADTYKSIGDRLTNINGGTGSLTSSFGGVAGFNTGFRIGDQDRIRGQIGGSYGAYDPKGRLALIPQANEVEEQEFVTAGVYKRGDMLNDCDPISWGLVVDYFHANQWGINANTVDLTQLRGIAGYAINECTEVGGWGTFRLWDDAAAVTVAGAPGVLTRIRAANQANAYIRRNTAFGASFMAYIGAFDRADIQSWQFGLNATAPVSCNMALYGNFNYAVPGAAAGPAGSGEEQFNVQVGLAYYFGGKAVSPSVTGDRGLPLLNVANNGSFLITD